MSNRWSVPPIGGVCNLCGGGGAVAAVAISHHEGRTVVGLCVDCLAEGIEAVTGYRVRRQLRAWQANRELAAAMRDDRPRRGPKSHRTEPE